MEERKTFIVQDENGLQSVAEIITMIEVEGLEYVVYSIDRDVENSDVFVARVIKDENGNDKIITIENEEERTKIFEIVQNLINRG